MKSLLLSAMSLCVISTHATLYIRRNFLVFCTLFESLLVSKFYIPSTLNMDYFMGYFFHFSQLWLKIYSTFNWKFRIEIQNAIFFSDFRSLLDVQSNLPETSPFLSAQMAVLSSSFSVFTVLGTYNLYVQTEVWPLIWCKYSYIWIWISKALFGQPFSQK